MVSSLRPLAIWFSSSIWVRSAFEVVQAWVKVRPWALSAYLPSRLPATRVDFESRFPSTLKVTLEGVPVLTSREVPEKW